MKYYFNYALLKDDSIRKMENHFIDVARKCIEYSVDRESRNGLLMTENHFFVNDKKKYDADQHAIIDSLLNRTYKMNFTYMQYAYFIQTGEIVGFLGD